MVHSFPGGKPRDTEMAMTLPSHAFRVVCSKPSAAGPEMGTEADIIPALRKLQSPGGKQVIT